MGVTPSSAQRALDTLQDWWLTIRHRRFFYGWWIVIVAFFSDLVGTGATAYTFGVFYKPLGDEFGWSRSMIAGVATGRSLVSSVIGPVIGPLVDHRDSRAIMAVGGVVGGLSLIAMGFISNDPAMASIQFYILYGVLGALALTATSSLVTQTTVAKWFIRKRGRVTAITSMGVSVAGIVMVPLATLLIAEFGWRTAWATLGVIAMVVMVPLSLLMRRTPEDMGLNPDGEKDPVPTQTSATPAPARASEATWTLSQAVRTRALWLIIISYNLASVSVSAILLHQINYMSDKGFSATTAAAVVSFYSFCAIIAKLIWGLVAEKVHVQYLNVMCFSGIAAGIIVLINATSVWQLFLFSAVYGLTRGAYVLLTPLTYADYCGRTVRGAIRVFS